MTDLPSVDVSRLLKMSRCPEVLVCQNVAQRHFHQIDLPSVKCKHCDDGDMGMNANTTIIKLCTTMTVLVLTLK